MTGLRANNMIYLLTAIVTAFIGYTIGTEDARKLRAKAKALKVQPFILQEELKKRSN